MHTPIERREVVISAAEIEREEAREGSKRRGEKRRGREWRVLYTLE
jgi:hypothetical protein